jgi:PPOX class probable F420-dependent enzyme
MSRRDQIRMTPEEVDAYLHEPHLCRIGTMNQDGTIHLVAMNYGFVDGLPAFWTYRRAQKTLNLQRNPTISMIVDSGYKYSDLKGVSIVGTGTVRLDEAAMEQFLASIGERYGGGPRGSTGRAANASAPKRAVVTVHAERVLSWDHGKLGGVY